MLMAFCESAGINAKIPFNELEEHQKKAILHGSVDDILIFLEKA